MSRLSAMINLPFTGRSVRRISACHRLGSVRGVNEKSPQLKAAAGLSFPLLP